jgi:hypothetical protein
MKRIEKIEIKKSSGIYYYTGELRQVDDDWVEITTTRGETLRFRSEQIDGRQLIEMRGDDENGRKR